MRRLLLTLLLFAILNAGDYADAFLQTALPAGSLSMGRSILTVPEGIAAVAGNPAGIAMKRENEVMLQYASLFNMAFHHAFGFSMPLKNDIQLSVSWYRSGVNDIPIRPELSDTLDLLERRTFLRENFGGNWGYFSDREDAVYLTLGRFYAFTPRPGWAYDPIHLKIPIALNIKYLNKNTFENSARGIGVDLGLRVIVPGNEIFYIRHLGELSFGFSLHDVYVSGLYWDNGHVDLIDMTFHQGISLKQHFPGVPVLLTLSHDFSNMTGDGAHSGMELKLFDVLSVRAGRDESSWTMGSGLEFRFKGLQITADYAFRQHELDPSHRISIYLSPIEKDGK